MILYFLYNVNKKFAGLFNSIWLEKHSASCYNKYNFIFLQR